MKDADRSQRREPLVIGQQIIFPKNLEQRANEFSLIVVTDVATPHWLSIPIRSQSIGVSAVDNDINQVSPDWIGQLIAD